MIIARRVLALSLIPLVIVTLAVMLVVLRVDATVLEPRFYTSTLHDVDAYNFLYDEALPIAIRESGIDLEATAPLGLDLTPEAVAGYARRTVPPPWLEQNVATVIHQVLPYLTGRTDSFSVHVRLDDRAEAAAAVVRDAVHDADLHAFLIEGVLRPELERNDALFQDMPFGLSLTPEDVIDGIVEVVPEEWLRAQVLAALDSFTPYVTGQSDSFQLLVPLQERADVLVAVLRRWVQAGMEEGAYEYFIDELVAPMVRNGIAGGVQLPYGVTLTEAEVMEAVRNVLPPSWVAARADEAIVATGEYLTGRTEVLLVRISIEDRLELAAQQMVNLADSRFAVVYNTLPVCTFQQLQNLDLSSQAMPECRPSGVSYTDIKSVVGLDVFDEVALAMIRTMPTNITLNEQLLLSGLGAETVSSVRRMLSEGYTITETDLDNLLVDQGGPNLQATFADIRGYLRDGMVFTEAAVREQAGPDFAQMDSVRGIVGTGRSLLFVMLLAPMGFVAMSGFLGGRSWPGRLGWAGAPLFVAGLLLLAGILVGVSLLRETSEGVLQGMDAPSPVVAKLADLRDVVLTRFFGPLQAQSVGAIAIGLGAVVGGFLLARRRPVPAPRQFTAHAGPASEASRE